jgi:hypothetical protein
MPLRRLALAAALVLPLSAQPAWSPELSLTVRGVGSVVPSPDGSLVAYTETRNVIEEERSEQLTHLWLASARRRPRRRQLTRRRPQRHRPRLLPRFPPSLLPLLPLRPGQPLPPSRATAAKPAAPPLERPDAYLRPLPDGRSIVFAGLPDDPDEARAAGRSQDFRVIDANPDPRLWLLPVQDAARRPPPPRRTSPATPPPSTGPATPRSLVFEHWPRPRRRLLEPVRSRRN